MITNNLSSSATAYFKPAGGTALSIANGKTILAYCTGTTMVPLNYVDTAGNATTSTSTTNISGGVASQIPYQSGAGTTSFIANGTSGQALVSAGASAPYWGALGVVGGGTGAATLSGIAYGNGTSAFTAATAAQIVSAIGTTAVTNATNATNITNSGGWSVTPSGTKLYFNYNGTNVASLDSSGNLTTLGSHVAGGTP
jgi:hypothetical protein